MVQPVPTQEDILAIVRALVPASFFNDLENLEEGLGLDPYELAAAIYQRVVAALDVTQQAYYLKPHSTQTQPPAAGASQATAAITIVRTGDASAELDLVAAIRLQSQYLTPTGETGVGPVFRLQSDVTLPAGSLSVAASAIADRPGYQGNVPAGSIVIFEPVRTLTVTGSVLGNVLTDDGTPDRFNRELVGRYVRFTSGANIAAGERRIIDAFEGTVTVDGPALVTEAAANISVLSWEDLGLSITQAAPATGGRHAWLDAIGEERRVFRQTGESDDAYRDRICQLADTIAPNAILRIASLILDPLSIGFELKETRDPTTWPALVYDVDAYDVGDFFTNGYPVGCQLFTSFVICVGLGNQGEFGMSYDDSSTPGLGAYDADGAYDGYPVGYAAALGALYAAVDAARAAGVCFDLVLDPTL